MYEIGIIFITEQLYFSWKWAY